MGDLYWGDNLEILRNYVKDETIDLIYLDPPFNSNRNYNVLFKESSKVESEAQIEAFTDTWKWTQQAEETYDELVGGNLVPQRVSDLITAMRSFIGSNDVMAYLVMMTIRLIELHRVLKPTGSIYLHCDTTASHYLKVVMDTIWGPKNFRSEIIWKRQSAHSDAKHQFPDVADIILFYVKSSSAVFSPQYGVHDPEYVTKFYRFDDEDDRGSYRLGDMTSPSPRPNMMYEWMGFAFPAKGWRYQRETMQRLHDEGRIYYPRHVDGELDTSRRPALKRYFNEQRGSITTNIWTDINSLHSSDAERLGYPTQKPEALLERIINASSKPGDLVLDPFCGCGTSIAVAERLDRKWVGIDITHLAIAAIINRMESAFPGIEIRRHGEPADLGGAQALALLDRYDFQNWALTLVAARPIAEDAKGKSKKGADRGIDGVISFLGKDAKTPARCLVQVKSGHVSSATIRDLVGTVDREKADSGLLITLEESTGPMRTEALEAGFYRSEFMQRDYPRMQMITIKDLLHGKEPQMPPHYSPYRLAERQRRSVEQPGLFDKQG